MGLCKALFAAVLLMGAVAILAGCPKSEDATASTTEDATWKPYPLPDYAKQELSDLRTALADDIEQHRSDVDRLFALRESIPSKWRFGIPAGPDALLAREVDQSYYQFRCERDLQAYLDNTADQGETRKFGEEFLREYLKHAAYLSDALPEDEIFALGQQALDAGSNDPIIRCYSTRYRGSAEISDEQILKLLLEQQPRLQEPHIPALTRMLVASWIWEWVKARGGDQLVDREYRFKAIEASVDYFVAEADSPNQRLVWFPASYLFNGFSEDEQREFLAACLAEGLAEVNDPGGKSTEEVNAEARSPRQPGRGIHPWIAHWMAGAYYKRVGLDRRGGDWAKNVSADQWRQFKMNLALAEDHFLRAWQLDPANPMPATEMIAIATGGCSSRWSDREWFYEAVGVQFDYLPTYDAYRYALWPRWGGSHIAMLQFASECVNTGRYDTNVPTQVSSILWDIQQEMGTPQRLLALPGVAELITEFTDGLAKAIETGKPCPADSSRTWVYLAGLLTIHGDYERAREIYQHHDPQKFANPPRAFAGMKQSFARGLAFAATGPAKEHVLKIQQQLEGISHEDEPDATQFDELAKLINQSRKVDEQPLAQIYYDDTQAIIDQLQAFYAGEWVELPFDEQLTGWRMQAAQYELSDDGALLVASNANATGISLQPLAQFPPPFLCEAELTRPPPEFRSGAWPAIIHGRTRSTVFYEPQMRRAILLSPNEDFAVIGYEPEEDKYWNRGTHLSDSEFHLLRLKIWSDQAEYSAEHEDIITLPIEEGATARSFTISELGALRPNRFHVRNVRVKRLMHGPPPSEEELDRWPAFYKAELEDDPLDSNAWGQLGYERLLRGDYPAALEFLSECDRLKPRLYAVEYHLGETLLCLERYEEAAEQFRRDIARQPEHALSHAYLAWLYASAPVEELHDPQRALEMARSAETFSEEEQWLVPYALAAAQAANGQFDAARQSIDKAIEQAPDDEKVLLVQSREQIAARQPVRPDRPPSLLGNSQPVEE